MQLAFEKKNPWDFDVNKNSRFGILPRHSKDGKDIRWFEFECLISLIFFLKFIDFFNFSF